MEMEIEEENGEEIGEGGGGRSVDGLLIGGLVLDPMGRKRIGKRNGL